MKKKLLALAVVSALGLPSAGFAESILYGQLHGSIDYFDNKDDNAVALSSNRSRVGVKGSFDLGAGAQSIYLAEWEVGLTDSELNLRPRNQVVGLKGGFGTLFVGRNNTPVKEIGRKVDLFWSTQLGQNRTLTALADGGLGFDQRLDNVVGYTSPNIGPISIFGMYSADTDVDQTLIPGGVSSPDFSDGTNDFDAFSANLAFDLSGIYLAAGYEQHNILEGSIAGLTKDSESAIRAGASIDIVDTVILTGFFQDGKDLGFVAGRDRQIFGGGLAVQFLGGTLKGQVYRADDLEGAGSATILTGENTGALLYSVGYDQALSKSTDVYINGAYLDNDDATRLALGGNGHGESARPAVAGDAVWGVSTGIRVKF